LIFCFEVSTEKGKHHHGLVNSIRIPTSPGVSSAAIPIYSARIEMFKIS
jgi:hypothetical protein